VGLWGVRLVRVEEGSRSWGFTLPFPFFRGCGKGCPGRGEGGSPLIGRWFCGEWGGLVVGGSVFFVFRVAVVGGCEGTGGRGEVCGVGTSWIWRGGNKGGGGASVRGGGWCGWEGGLNL